MTTRDDYAFVHVVEPGRLEHQSVLLAESLRRFGGDFKDCDIYAVNPSQDRPISEETLNHYRRLRVTFVSRVLNRAWSDYPYLNTSYAAAHVEGIAAGKCRVIVLLDSDTIFLSPPDGLVLAPDEKIGIRPIDSVRRQVAVAPGEPSSEYWKEVFSACEFDGTSVWTVRTTVEGKEIIAYFNNGVIVSRIENKLFTKCIDAIERARPRPYFQHLSHNSLEWHFLDQAFTSALIMRDFRRTEVRILGPEYNYPLSPEILPEEKEHGFSRVSILHYHSLFESKELLNRFSGLPRVHSFLDAFLPLGIGPERRLFFGIARVVPEVVRRRIMRSPLNPLVRRLARLFDVRVV